MVKIAIGTKNPAKIKAGELAGRELSAELISIDVPSEVSEQPFSDEETIEGALNRAKNAMRETQADFGLGLEGGVVKTPYGLFICNWGALVTKENKSFVSGGARIKLPDEIADELYSGRELGPVMDEYTKKQDIRKSEGAVGIFSNGRIKRDRMFEHIIELLVGQYEYQVKEQRR
jgi:inosine/xanthosine triphosphatase